MTGAILPGYAPGYAAIGTPSTSQRDFTQKGSGVDPKVFGRSFFSKVRDSDRLAVDPAA